MDLNLRYEPIPGNAPRFAEDIVRATKDLSGVNLDYTPASLAIVDEIIQGFVQDGCEVNDVKETLFGFGCYVGEVFVRAGHGFWRAPRSPWEVEVLGFPLVVDLGPDNVCNPIGKVFKRLQLGDSENLPYFYSVFATDKAAVSSPASDGPWWKRLFKKT